jgi:iron complex outermembrane receptor protein
MPTFLRRCRLAASTLLAATLLTAAQPPAGSITGRVFNPDLGEYVERARLTIEGTDLEAFTDADGRYRFPAVPAGSASVRAFRTGAPALTGTALVAAGQTATLDFNLPSTAPRADGTVKLAEFVVGTSREMSGAALAINTQRFAPNTMNVLAADEFGPVASGNIGEIMKSVPGVTIGLGGLGAPYTISLNGVPADYVPVTIGGFTISDPASGTGRTSGIHQLSLNNMARIETVYTPTPETTGSALAGSVNLVPRSALERTRPVFNAGVSLIMRDRERSLRRTAGPRREATAKAAPELNFSAVVPLSPRVGFTFSASRSSTYAPLPLLTMTRRGVNGATNGGAFPDTTPDNAYLTDFAVRDRVAFIGRSTAAATLDFRLSPQDRVSLSLQHGSFRSPQENHTLTYLANRVAPGDFSPAFTRGATGAGEIRLTSQSNAQDDQLWMPAITLWHDGPVWKAEAGAGFSSSIRWTTDLQNSHFGTSQARRQNVTVSFADVGYLGPRSISVTDGTTGAPVDPYSLSSYSLNTAGANNGRRAALQTRYFANLRRDLPTTLPITTKLGGEVSESMRDVRLYAPTFTHVGADGRAGTADDAAAPFRNDGLSLRPGDFGQRGFEKLNVDALYDTYRLHPDYFQVSEASVLTSRVAQSKHGYERIAAGYFRGDTQLLHGRLRLTGGLRAELTNARGEGQLIDPTRNYQRDAAGRVVTVASPTAADPNRRVPALVAPAGSLEATRLTNVDRGLHAAKEYLRWFPSLNGSYAFREDLVARAGYYWSVGRPDLAQYAGSLTLPDTENPPGPGNRIVTNNAAIKAWSARTWKVTLEHYFADVGVVSVSGFHREIENFFGSTVFTPGPDFLGLYGLDPAIYGRYDVQTQYNLPGKVRMTGVDFNYKQALTFLPAWARGVQVFANGSAQRATGQSADNFSGYIPRTLNWGASLTRPGFTLRTKWNFVSRARRGAVAAGRSIEPGTYNWSSDRQLLDVSGELALRRNTALFFNLTNLRDAPADTEVAGPNTPGLVRLSQRQTFGSLWTVGIKATF